ncbi:hypothetical protein U1Q18_029587, partial [Sarracenia purpurea var. burkii]
CKLLTSQQHSIVALTSQAAQSTQQANVPCKVFGGLDSEHRGRQAAIGATPTSFHVAISDDFSAVGSGFPATVCRRWFATEKKRLRDLRRIKSLLHHQIPDYNIAKESSLFPDQDPWQPTDKGLLGNIVALRFRNIGSAKKTTGGEPGFGFLRIGIFLFGNQMRIDPVWWAHVVRDFLVKRKSQIWH